ncbi:MAG: hypothetical protein K2Z81_24560 [Cyanobacteria bacterium]|nr:hypothetical protein [Cyanobacteriota bacterium]
MRITRTVAIFFLVPVTIQIVLLFFMHVYLQDLNEKLSDEIRKKDLQALIDNVQHKHTNSLAAAFLTSLTGYERIRKRYNENAVTLKQLIAQLQEQTKSNRELAELVNDFSKREQKLLQLETILLRVSIAKLPPSTEQSDKGRAVIRKSMQDLRRLQAKVEHKELTGAPGLTGLFSILSLTMLFSFLSLFSAFVWSKNILSLQLAGIFEKVREIATRTRMTPATLPPGEMAQVEAAVISAGEQISKLESARQELSSMVAHDLKAPLTSVAGSLELIENERYGAISQSALTSLSRIRAISDKLVFVISILLEFARVKASTSGIQPMPGERVEDAIYEELENQGLTDIKAFSCDIGDHSVTLPVEPLSRLVAFLIKSFDKPQSVSLKMTEKQGQACMQLRMTNGESSSPSGHSDTREESIRTAALMSNIYGAQLSHTQEDSYDEIEVLFPGSSSAVNQQEPSHIGSRDKFRSKLLFLLSFSFMVNLITILAIVSASFIGHRQLEKEIQSRNVVHWASNVSSDLTELLILAILRDPQVDQDRQRVRRQIEKAIKKINTARGSLRSDRDLSRWESNIRGIMEVTSEIASAQQKIPSVIDMVNKRHFDESVLIDAGSFVVSNEIVQSSSSQRLLTMLESLSSQIMTISIIGCLASIGTAVLLGRYLIRRLSSVRGNADRLRTRRKLLKPAPGSDDIAYLDRFFYNTAHEIDDLERERQKLLTLLRDDLSVPVNQIRSSIDELNQQEILPERARDQQPDLSRRSRCAGRHPQWLHQPDRARLRQCLHR